MFNTGEPVQLHNSARLVCLHAAIWRAFNAQQQHTKLNNTCILVPPTMKQAHLHAINNLIVQVTIT